MTTVLVCTAIAGFGLVTAGAAVATPPVVQVDHHQPGPPEGCPPPPLGPNGKLLPPPIGPDGKPLPPPTGTNGQPCTPPNGHPPIPGA
ncbi:hypothetical protein [Nocardia sp. N2S4-5]|uniref:hypothetical protein n=1 Tax=Nocardia sp. N2S4-5 TaxID=3351565 RepID=UPI0037CD3C1C